jgi:hypothetical protein
MCAFKVQKQFYFIGYMIDKMIINALITKTLNYIFYFNIVKPSGQIKCHLHIKGWPQWVSVIVIPLLFGTLLSAVSSPSSDVILPNVYCLSLALLPSSSWLVLFL